MAFPSTSQLSSVGAVPVFGLTGRQIQYGDLVHLQAAASGIGPQLLLVLSQRHEQAAAGRIAHEVLYAERGLPAPRATAHKISTLWKKTAIEDVVQTVDAGGQAGLVRVGHEISASPLGAESNRLSSRKP